MRVGHIVVGLVEQGGHGLGGVTVGVGVQGPQPGLAQGEQRQVVPQRLDLHDVIAAQVHRQHVGLQVRSDRDAAQHRFPQSARRRVGGVEHAVGAHQGHSCLGDRVGCQAVVAALVDMPQRGLRYRLQGRAGDTPRTTTGHRLPLRRNRRGPPSRSPAGRWPAAAPGCGHRPARAGP